MSTNRTLLILALGFALPLLAGSPLYAGDAASVRVKDGRVQEYVNGSLRRTYGSGIVDAATDGTIVAAVNKDGRVMEYVNGSLRRTYGSDVVRVQVSGGSVFANLRNGRTAEYVNGSLRRTF
jgi:hypothetical protein